MDIEPIWNLDIFETGIRDTLRTAMDGYCQFLQKCQKPQSPPIGQPRWLNDWKKFNEITDKDTTASTALECTDAIPAAGFRFQHLAGQYEFFNMTMDIACRSDLIRLSVGESEWTNPIKASNSGWDNNYECKES